MVEIMKHEIRREALRGRDARAPRDGVFRRRERGFSLIELLIAMGITLIILAAAFMTFKSATDISSASTQVYEANQNLQTAINLIRRDLRKAGNGGDDTNGIKKQDGNAMLYFVEPGGSLGNEKISILYSAFETDSIMAKIGEDDDGKCRLMLRNPPENDPEAARRFFAIRENDIVAWGNVWQTVNSLDDTTPPRSIKLDGATGCSTQNVDIKLLRRVTYYLEDGWLMRNENEKEATRLIPGVTKFALEYAIANGKNVDREKTVEDFSPIGTGSVRDILMVSVTVACESEISPNKDYANSLTTKVALPNFKPE